MQRRIPAVADRQTALEKALAFARTAAVAVAIAAAAGLGIYLGVGGLIRPLLQRAGLWIDRRTRASAELDAKTIERGLDPREAVAARRAADPAHDAAYRRAARKRAPVRRE